MLSNSPTPPVSPLKTEHLLLAAPTAVSGASCDLSIQGVTGNAKLTYTWSVASAPPGGTARFSAVASAPASEMVTFNEAGSYSLNVRVADTTGYSVTLTKSVTVVPTLSSISLSTSSGQHLTSTPFDVSGTSEALVVQGLDQFGKALATQPAFKWSITSPSGNSAPGLKTSGATTTLTFAGLGTYGVTVSTSANSQLTAKATLIVTPTATSITVTPGTASLAQGAHQQFTDTVYDQFHHAMTVQPQVTWTATGGTVTSAGLFTAGSVAGNYQVVAHSGTLSGSVAVSVQASSSGLQNAFLASLVTSLDADGSISRGDMLQIFNSVEAKGTVTASELSDLKAILGEAAKLSMPGYVQVLSGDVINGSQANATFQGKTLGNLAVGSSATQLNELVGKWFLGQDEPALSDPSFVYRTASGSLFPQTPSHLNEFQGELGDCYFISSLGTIADSNPSAIENMIIDNGDGTYTVRFYTGNYGASYNSNGSWSDGFTNGAGTPEYVTVDRKLATTSSGMLVYADYGASYTNSANALWIPLLEKAYAEWNQTGQEGRNGQNSFAAIEGGWMATVDAQVLGHNATDYNVSDADKQYAISALAAHEAVTIGTWTANYGLYASHAYAITGYNAATDTFTLYNPWGFDQPGQLTWSQLEATCDGFVVASTAGSTSITSGLTHGGVEAAAVAAAAAGGESANSGGQSEQTAAVQANNSTSAVNGATLTAVATTNGTGLFSEGELWHVEGGEWIGEVLAGETVSAVFAEGGSPCDAA